MKRGDCLTSPKDGAVEKAEAPQIRERATRVWLTRILILVFGEFVTKQSTA
jgi:hypothetical protein